MGDVNEVIGSFLYLKFVEKVEALAGYCNSANVR